jgi:hypothetical protein
MSTFRPLRVRHRRSLLTCRSSFRRPVAKAKRRPRVAPSLGSAGHSIGGKGGATTAAGGRVPSPVPCHVFASTQVAAAWSLLG